MGITRPFLHYSYDSSLVFLKLSYDHYQYLWEKKCLGSHESYPSPALTARMERGMALVFPRTHSILSDNGRSGSSTKDKDEVDSGSQHTFPSNQQEV